MKKLQAVLMQTKIKRKHARTHGWAGVHPSQKLPGLQIYHFSYQHQHFVFDTTYSHTGGMAFCALLIAVEILVLNNSYNL